MIAAFEALGFRVPQSEYESFIYGTCAAAVLQVRPHLRDHQAAIPVAAWMVGGLVQKGFREASDELALWNELPLFFPNDHLRLCREPWVITQDIIEKAFWRQVAAYSLMEGRLLSYQQAMDLLEAEGTPQYVLDDLGLDHWPEWEINPQAPTVPPL